MAQCIQCGKELKEGAAFCGNCGTPVKGQATNAQATPAVPAETTTAPSVIPSLSNAQPTLSTKTIQIDRSTIKWAGDVLATRFIERVTTSVPKPSFPKLSILLLLIGVACIFFLPPVGITCLLVAAAWICWWGVKWSNAPKGITFFLNSGRNVSIFFNDHSFADQVMDAAQAAIADDSKHVNLSLPANMEFKVKSSGGNGQSLLS